MLNLSAVASVSLHRKRNDGKNERTDKAKKPKFTLEYHEDETEHEPQRQCRGNAVMERYFPNLKMERVWQRDYANYQETNDITDYSVGFYNSQRLHSTLGYRPPNAYERERAA